MGFRRKIARNQAKVKNPELKETLETLMIYSSQFTKAGQREKDKKREERNAIRNKEMND